MSSPRRVISPLILALLAATALAVVLAGRQITLSRAYAELWRRVTRPHAGLVVPPFLATTLAGDTLTIGQTTDSSVRQVLLVLTTTCPYCRATLPVWAELTDSLSHVGGGGVRVIAVSLDSLAATKAFAARQSLRYPVTLFPTEKFRQWYQAGSVAQTVVLDGDGEVLYAHVGQLSPGPALDSVYRAAVGAAVETPQHTQP